MNEQINQYDAGIHYTLHDVPVRCEYGVTNQEWNSRKLLWTCSASCYLNSARYPLCIMELLMFWPNHHCILHSLCQCIGWFNPRDVYLTVYYHEFITISILNIAIAWCRQREQRLCNVWLKQIIDEQWKPDRLPIISDDLKWMRTGRQNIQCVIRGYFLFKSF